MIDLLVNIKNFILNLLATTASLIKSSVQSFPKLINEIKGLKAKLRNLKDINFELVDFYIKNGNISDAILRLKIINKFIVQNDAAINYKLAWCYFVKSDFVNSLRFLDKSQGLDLLGLKNYLIIDEVSQIPENILMEYKNLALHAYYTKFISNKVNLHSEIAASVAQHLKFMPDECQILDLEACLGLNARALNSILAKKYKITGVESSNQMLCVLRESRLYDKLEESSVRDFLQNNTMRYDVVISLCGLSFFKDQKEGFVGLNKSLKPGGILVLVFEKNEVKKINSKRTEFLYNSDDFENSIEGCYFKIVASKGLVFDKLKSYQLIVCKDNNPT